MAEHFDTLETRDPEIRERAQLSALPARIAFAKTRTAAYAKILAGVEPASIESRAALAQLPVTRKSEFLELQKASRPFGGFAASRWGEAPRVFASPGPIYELDGAAPDYWRLARALFAAGFRRGDLVHNCFSYHCTPAGSMLECGAHALGCTVFAGGTGQTEQQVQAMADLGPAGYVGTPSFLKIILEKADELGVALPTLNKALVSGEAFLPSVRDALSARGIAGFQAYASADVGSIAYESEARDGLIGDEGVILEIVRPGTGDPVAAGEVGEVIVTTLAADAYPLIRFGTGDLSAVVPASLGTASACGRTNVRIRGWLGRADQTTKVKGMFVHPSQVAEIVRRHPGIVKARLAVDHAEGADRMTLHVEGRENRATAEAIVASMREVTKLRGEVVFHAPGELANDGKVIEDLRKYT
ncbi:MAG TPA: phenylacetate--CoA ligase family protein [Casimicrobiaceae bacterium]|nr:phenylacetate--CoA ligase family protein [Casimicrobiaceae bacterium]